jgi:hypothetical protein
VDFGSTFALEWIFVFPIHQDLLSSAKTEFFELVTSKSGLNYFNFGAKKKAASAAPAGKNETSEASA